MENRDYTQFQGKKILFLGAHVLTVHMIRQAKKMGIYTIVTDYIENAPAKRIADEAYDISTMDIDALVALARDKKVDGVYASHTDVNLVPCRKVCDILGLPFYATMEQIEQTLNKINFKNNCRKYGVPVVEDVNPEYLNGKYDKITYPVIIKPADSYSSRGISVCHNKEEMPAAVEKALKASACKQIVAEQYLEAEDIYLYFTVQNGYLSLSAMADRLLNDEQYGCAPQPVGYFFPSKYIDLYYEKVHDNLQKMINGLDIKNGSFFLQGFVSGSDIVFFEMGFRLSGGAGYLQIAKQNEINQVEMHLRYALTGKFDGWDLKTYDNPRFERPACVLVVLLKNGKIARIDGLEEVLAKENIFDIVQFRHVGDELNEKGTLNQVFARIYMIGKDEEDLRESVKFVKRHLRIVDTENNNMILNLFDEDSIYKEE